MERERDSPEATAATGGNEQLRKDVAAIREFLVNARDVHSNPKYIAIQQALVDGINRLAAALSHGEDAELVKRLRLAAEIQDDANREHAADLYREAADALAAALSVSGGGDAQLRMLAREQIDYLSANRGEGPLRSEWQEALAASGGGDENETREPLSSFDLSLEDPAVVPPGGTTRRVGWDDENERLRAANATAQEELCVALVLGADSGHEDQVLDRIAAALAALVEGGNDANTTPDER